MFRLLSLLFVAAVPLGCGGGIQALSGDPPPLGSSGVDFEPVSPEPEDPANPPTREEPEEPDPSSICTPSNTLNRHFRDGWYGVDYVDFRERETKTYCAFVPEPANPVIPMIEFAVYGRDNANCALIKFKVTQVSTGVVMDTGATGSPTYRFSYHKALAGLYILEVQEYGEYDFKYGANCRQYAIVWRNY